MAKKKKKREFDWRLFLASILFIAAGLLLSAGPIRTYLIGQMQSEQLTAVTKVTAQEIKENETKEAEFDFNQVQAIDLSLVLEAKAKASNFLTLGLIAIPSVDLNLPIYKGVANEVLLAGAGTMKPDQKMGEGNYALASHHYFPDPKLLFSPLVNMKVGDKIYLTDQEYVYEYETTSIDLVSAYQVEVIYDVPGVTEITLITCDDEQATNRYSIKGKFIQKMSVHDVTQEVKDAFDQALNTL